MREIVDAIMPIIAFLVVCALFSIPAIWGMVVSTSSPVSIRRAEHIKLVIQ